jgi:hypothetical protein
VYIASAATIPRSSSVRDVFELRSTATPVSKKLRELLDELGKVRDQQRRGIPIATTTLTVAEYMTYWLEHVAEPSIFAESRHPAKRTIETGRPGKKDTASD